VAEQHAQGLAEVTKERAVDLAELAEERLKMVAEMDARVAARHREVATMHRHKQAQEDHVELNIGIYRFQTSVQTLRRILQTFFDAYFSGLYAQDVFRDGRIFWDRDGEHFGHINLAAARGRAFLETDQDTVVGAGTGARLLSVYVIQKYMQIIIWIAAGNPN
jgi:hypothetical protein